MRKICLILGVCICFLLCGCTATREYAKTIFAMDTIMDLKVYDENEAALSAAETEIKRIDSLLDRGKENSEIYWLNKNKRIDASTETAKLFQEALSVSKKTDGAFDITIAPVMDLWGFYGGTFHVPEESELQAALSGVGYEKIKLETNCVAMPENTSIDLGGIGKGYASDRAAAVLRENGAASAILSLGGNVYALGKKPDGGLWNVGITDPHNKTQMIGWLSVSDKAIVTSGGYQRYFEQDGAVYHHIIDPKTAKSADSGLASVTVIADSGTQADALSTALFVMGLDKSAALWRTHSDFEAVFVDDSGEIYITKGIENVFSSEHSYQVIT